MVPTVVPKMDANDALAFSAAMKKAVRIGGIVGLFVNLPDFHLFLSAFGTKGWRGDEGNPLTLVSNEEIGKVTGRPSHHRIKRTRHVLLFQRVGTLGKVVREERKKGNRRKSGTADTSSFDGGERCTFAPDVLRLTQELVH
jgi:hypothetical protein